MTAEKDIYLSQILTTHSLLLIITNDQNIPSFIFSLISDDYRITTRLSFVVKAPVNNLNHFIMFYGIYFGVKFVVL